MLSAPKPVPSATHPTLNSLVPSPERLRRPGEPRGPHNRAQVGRPAPGRELRPGGRPEGGGGRRGGRHRVGGDLHQPEGPLHQVPPRGRPVEAVQGRQRPGARMGRRADGERR